MKLLAYWLLGSLLILRSGPTRAQADTTTFICPGFFEPIPELVSGGGMQGIIKAIQRRVIFPPDALAAEVEGRVFVSFTVTPAGAVKRAAVVKPLWPSCDSAAVSAVRQLPCFKPRAEKYGDMSYTAPITFRLAEDPPATRRPQRKATAARQTRPHPLPHPTSAACLRLPAQEPMSDAGRRAVEAAIYQRLVFPPVCLRDQTNGSVVIRLTIAPAGNVQQVTILKGLVAPFDQAVVKAARQLCCKPRPAQAGAVSFGVGISFEKAVSLPPTTGARQHKLALRRNSTP